MLAGAALLVMAVTSSQLDLEAQNRAWCAVHRNDDKPTRTLCADSAWCSTHWNEDEASRIGCDPFRSRADTRLPAPNLTRASLARSRNLNESEKRSQCGGACFRVEPVGFSPPPPDGRLLPGSMTNAKLAMRAEIGGDGGDQIVKIGFASDGSVISVNFSRRLGGPRRTVTAALTDAEMDRILSALDKSHFWQLPAYTNRSGPNVVAQIEVSIPGRQHHVVDTWTQSPEAVDLAVLAATITSIVSARWKGI